MLAGSTSSCYLERPGSNPGITANNLAYIAQLLTSASAYARSIRAPSAMSEITINEEFQEINKQYVIKTQKMAKDAYDKGFSRKSASQYSYARWSYQNWVHRR